MSTVVTKKQARSFLAKNLRKLIDEHKVKQADVAKAIKVNGEEMQAVRQRIYRYVHGKTDVVGDDLLNIAEFFGVSTDSLLARPARKKSGK